MTMEEVVQEAVRVAVRQEMGDIRERLDQLVAALPPQFMTIEQAAQVLGCAKGTVRRMLKAGRLTYKRVGLEGKGIRIDARSLHGAGGKEGR